MKKRILYILSWLLFRFLNGEDVEVREIPIKNQNLKSADLNSFIWVIWYYWNSIKTLKQEKLISFITKFFQNVYKDFQEKGHPKISNTTIKSHLKDNTGNKIKIPKELMKGTNKIKRVFYVIEKHTHITLFLAAII